MQLDSDKNLFVLLICLIKFSFCIAQKNGRMVTDRPDQTESPTITKMGYFQFETGFNFEKEDVDNATITHPTLLLRYGIIENFEIRVNMDFATQIDNISTCKNEQSTGLMPIEIGGKYNIVDGNGMFPDMAIIFGATPNFLASENFKRNYWGGNIKLAAEKQLSDKLQLGYNIGVDWAELGKQPHWIYTNTCGVALTERLEVYAEIFGAVHKLKKPDHNIAAGTLFYLNNNASIDISCSKSISDQNKWYTAVGFSFRIK